MDPTIDTAPAGGEELAGLREQPIGPNDSRYEEARAVYNAMIDRRPALIARAATPDEVTRVVNYARERGRS